MMKRTILSLVSMAFIAAMTLTSCDEIMSAIDNPVGSYVQFNDSVLNLLPEEVGQNVATTISTEKVTYTSSDKSIATVDPNGFVTAISYGEAIITASVPANENYQAGSASYKVKVGSEAEKALKEGAIVSFDLNVDGVDESVSFKKVGDNFVIENPMASAPRRAAAIITSYSLGYNKATNIMTLLVKQTDGINTAYPLTVIFDLNKNTMQIIPGSPLSTVLFVNIKINGVTITGKLTKKEVAPEAVAITAPATPFVMNVGGDDVTLTAVVNPADATDKKVTWSSSAPAVATIDKTGKVHAVAAGTATIKAVTSNGKEATVELTVTDGPSYSTPLTFEVISEGDKTITVTKPQAGMYYKKNGGDQVALTANVNATINVTKDDKVEFYGTATSYNGTKFGGTAEVNVYGNIMSLISATGFADNKTLSADYTFAYLFNGYTTLKDASNLFLPATTLATQCYYAMFYGCTNLTTAPEELPAATLTQGCYYAMFYGCTNLTTAPKLPAESLANSCYRSMFQYCTSLTAAPKLPAESLANSCYRQMFRGCTSLTTAPKLPATTLAQECYYAMFNQCSSLKDAYVKAAFDAPKCANMFLNCTAAGAKLHTTSVNKASWDSVMGSGKTWSTWTADADWTD